MAPAPGVSSPCMHAWITLRTGACASIQVVLCITYRYQAFYAVAPWDREFELRSRCYIFTHIIDVRFSKLIKKANGPGPSIRFPGFYPFVAHFGYAVDVLPQSRNYFILYHARPTFGLPGLSFHL